LSNIVYKMNEFVYKKTIHFKKKKGKDTNVLFNIKLFSIEEIHSLSNYQLYNDSSFIKY
jgi:hypothetical protein